VSTHQEIVRRIYEALNRRDFEATLELVDDEFELDVTTNVFNPAVYRGPEELRRWAEQVFEVWEEFLLEPEELVASGESEKVLARVRVRGVGRGSGVELEDRIWSVWTIRDGLAVRCHNHAQDEEAARRDAATTEA